MKPIIIKEATPEKVVSALAYAIELEQDYRLTLGEPYYCAWSVTINGARLFILVDWFDEEGNPIEPSIDILNKDVTWTDEMSITDIHPKHGNGINPFKEDEV